MKDHRADSTNDTCEYGGYVTKCARESNKNVIPAKRNHLHTENATS